MPVTEGMRDHGKMSGVLVMRVHDNQVWLCVERVGCATMPETPFDQSFFHRAEDLIGVMDANWKTDGVFFQDGFQQNERAFLLDQPIRNKYIFHEEW